MSDKVREQFEAWTIRAGGHPSVLRRNAQGDYALGSVRAEYAVWQAARAEALEEAAEVCDEAARRCKSNSMAVSSTHARDNWLSEADSHIVNADAIRALKDKEPA